MALTYLDVLADYGLDPELVSGGREIMIRCPLCQSTGKKLYINAGSGLFICFVCEERGGSYRLFREVLELDHFQAMRLRNKIEGSDVRARPLYQVATKVETRAQGIKMPAEIHLLTDPAVPGQGIFWRYLDYRGVSAGDVERYRMGFALRGRYAYRLIIPVYSEGILWTFVARGLSNNEPRVLYPEDSKPSRALFNIDNVTTGVVFLVEGVFDALKIGDAAVASLGTNLSGYQRDLLRRKGVKTVFLLWDGDPPGRAGATHVAEQLHAARFDVRLGLLPYGKDPASATWDEIQAAVLHATPSRGGPIPIWLTDRLDAARAK